VLVAASILVLFLTFSVPRIYRWISKRFSSSAEYDLLVDEDADAEAETDVPLTPAPVMPSNGLVSDFKAHVRSLQEYGSILFAMEVLRVLCIGALLGLSIYAAIQAEPAPKTSGTSMEDDGLGGGHMEVLKKHKKKKGKHHKAHHDKLILGEYTPLELGEFGATAFYVSLFGHPLEILSETPYQLLMSGVLPDPLLPAFDAQTSYSGPPTAHRPSRYLAHPRLGSIRLPRPLPSRDYLSVPCRPRQLAYMGPPRSTERCGCCYPATSTEDVHPCGSESPCRARRSPP
jgi:hypothetical protein